jgi:hypothetical protein
LASGLPARARGWLYCPRSVPRSIAPSRGRHEVPPPRVARRPTGRAPNGPPVGSVPSLSCTPAEAAARTFR